MTLHYKATAKHPGACVLKRCRMAGSKIYEGDGLRVLACTQGHADAFMRIWTTPLPGMSREQLKANRLPALLAAQREAVTMMDEPGDVSGDNSLFSM